MEFADRKINIRWVIYFQFDLHQYFPNDNISIANTETQPVCGVDLESI